MSHRPVPDWDALTFTFTETDAMYRTMRDVSRDPIWVPGGVEPFGDLTVSPAGAFLSYGLGVFEGLKAFRCEDGVVRLFRPDMNAARFVRSAERLAPARSASANSTCGRSSPRSSVASRPDAAMIPPGGPARSLGADVPGPAAAPAPFVLNLWVNTHGPT